MHNADGSTSAESLDPVQLAQISALINPKQDNQREKLPNIPEAKEDDALLDGRIAVFMPDGSIISERKDWETFYNFVKAVGISNVKALNLAHAGVPLVDDKWDPKYASFQREIDNGMYLFCCMSNHKKKALIEDIAKALNIKVKVTLKAHADNPTNETPEHRPQPTLDLVDDNPIVVESKVINHFVLKVCMLLAQRGLLGRMARFLERKNTLISIENYGHTILPSIFIATTKEDLNRRNSVNGRLRWFTNPFTIGGQVVYLSTQWTLDFSPRLNLRAFADFVNHLYADKLVCKIGDDKFTLIEKS